MCEHTYLVGSSDRELPAVLYPSSLCSLYEPLPCSASEPRNWAGYDREQLSILAPCCTSIFIFRIGLNVAIQILRIDWKISYCNFTCSKTNVYNIDTSSSSSIFEADVSNRSFISSTPVATNIYMHTFYNLSQNTGRPLHKTTETRAQSYQRQIPENFRFLEHKI